MTDGASITVKYVRFIKLINITGLFGLIYMLLLMLIIGFNNHHTTSHPYMYTRQWECCQNTF